MHLHPDLAALRSDDAPQRAAQTALFAATAEWKRGMDEVFAALANYGEGDELSECTILAELLSHLGEAKRFATGFVANTASALAAAPLGHVPLRHFTDGTHSTLLLARSGRAALFVAAVNGHALADHPAPVSVSFADTESHEIILAGHARAEIISDRLERSALDLRPGSTIARHCAHQALVLQKVRGTLVSLRLQRRKAAPEPTREIELSSGRQIHQAAASAQDSRLELIIALLGRMGCSDAAPRLAEIAREQGPQSLRWQALRECLGLDTAVGFAALTAIAGSPLDLLSGPAGALRHRLIEAHPQLAEAALCPA